MEEKKSKSLNQINILGEKNNIDLVEELKDEEIEILIIQNFVISNEHILLLNKLKKLSYIRFVNCIFDNNEYLMISQAQIVLYNCKINQFLFEKNILLKNLEIDRCNFVDIKWLENCNLQIFDLNDTKLKNLSYIEKHTNLIMLNLTKINLEENDKINFDILSNLSKLNLFGSYIENIERYLFDINKNKTDKKIIVRFNDEKNKPIG